MIVHDVEQGTPEWFALRAGKPTASEFSKLITSKGEVSKSLEGYAALLAAEQYAGKPLDGWEGNKWTQRGNELEPDARALYEFMNDIELEQVGFVTDDLQLYGCSPDSLVNADGMVEIKCLKTENHVKAILYYKKHKKCPPDYVPQTQGQMLIAEREWCDLVFHHPDLPPRIIRQYRNDDLQKALSEQLRRVCEERDSILQTLKEM